MKDEDARGTESALMPAAAWALPAAVLGLTAFLFLRDNVPPSTKPAIAVENPPPVPPATPPISPPPPQVPREPVVDESLLPQERKEAEVILKQFNQLHQMLHAFAQSNDQKYPAGNTANEAMRQFFIKGLMDEERHFVFNGLGAPEHHPDEKIGLPTNGYAEAVAPGECDVSYQSNLTAGLDDATTPLLWYKTKAPSGMHYLICVRVAGDPKLYESETGKFIDPLHIDGREILSPENGVDLVLLLLPEVP